MISVDIETIDHFKSEYDQEMPQSQTADQPTVPGGRHTEHRQEHKSHRFSLPQQDDCLTRKYTKNQTTPALNKIYMRFQS